MAAASVVRYRMPGRMEKNKVFIEHSHMEEEPYKGTMEQVGFVDQAELEDVLL